MAVGRISGPLLKANLERNGIDLAFETDLLYLDVNNQRIGIKNASPQHELDITGTTRTNNITATSVGTFGDITLSGNTISTTQSFLNLGTLDTVVYQNKARIDSIDIEGNVISSNDSNADIEFRPNGTGTVEVLSNLNVTGNLHATGNITALGNITLGDANTDNIVINADIASNLVPDIDDFYTLGSDPATGGKRWSDIWVNNFNATSVQSDALTVSGINLILKPGNIFYVAENGSDTDDGDHPQAPFASIKHALSQVTAGDLIHIFPGEYTEIFPLTVPVGVTVKGHSIRSVNISPTTATRYNNAFLVNGESTVEDLTVKDFYSGGNYFTITNVVNANTFDVNVGITGQAHTYVSGGTVDFSDSTAPVNISSATYTESTGVLRITMSAPHDSFVGHSVFVSAMTFSCSGTNKVFPDDGYGFRFATDFEVTTRSPYIRNVTVLTKGTTITADDPRGFLSGDAGKGALVDGAYATAASREAAMLFHSVTFITPGVDGLTTTNGARIEWLNCFTYFANRGLHAFDSNAGFAYDGKTRIRLSGISGTFAAGNTVTFTSTDASSVVNVTVESVDNDVLIVDGKNTDLLGFDTTPQTISNGSGATATTIENVDVRDFGAEVRMIGSANVYGNFGLVGDGEGVIVYAIGQNLAYIGNGKEVSNDTGSVNQANEVVETNGAKIRFSSVDHKGDFRVGDLFHVNQETGTVDFSATQLNISLTDGVTFTDGSNTTFINGTRIDTGDIRISGNTITTTANNLVFDSFIDQITVNNDVQVNGNIDITGDVTIGGNITLGDSGDDNLQIVAGINSNLIPNVTNSFTIGSTTNRWANLFIDEVTIDNIVINDNFITTTDSNSDLELRANGTGKIVIPENNVEITNNLSVNGTVNLANTNIIGTINHTGNFNQTGTATVNNDMTVNQDLDVTGNAQFEEILVDGNFITTTTSNANLELRANGTGSILIPNNNLLINENLTVNGNANLLNIIASGTITSNRFTNNNILVEGNVITTTISNSDLELRANGTGIIRIPNNDVTISSTLTVQNDTTINGNLTVTNTLSANSLSVSGNINANTFTTGDILIDDNFIKTTNSNSNLIFSASGTGSVVVDDLQFTASTISSSNDITITPGTGTVNINATGSLKLPVGTTLQRPTPQSGQIRFNSDLARFEGYNGTVWTRLDGVYDSDNDTYITAELTPGANDNTIRFYANGSLIATLNETEFNTNQLAVDDIEINGNVISTTTANTDLELTANGTGSVKFENFAIKDSTITNTVSGAITTFTNTGTGYVKFDGTSGIVLPVGTNATRPTGVTGMIRFNTQDQRVELYDGSTWVSVAGASGGISFAQAEEIAIEKVLIFG